MRTAEQGAAYQQACLRPAPMRVRLASMRVVGWETQDDSAQRRRLYTAGRGAATVPGDNELPFVNCTRLGRSLRSAPQR